VKIGDEIIVTPVLDGANGKPTKAVVTYIHPQRRYYEVEYTGPAPNYHKYRETFPFQYRRGNGG